MVSAFFIPKNQMKKILLPLLLAASLAVQAKPVDMWTLTQVVAHVGDFSTPKEIEMLRIGDEMALFSWDGGFALLATDDCVRPVLAYSNSNIFSLEGMPSNLAGWIEGYRRDIAEKVAAGIGQTPQVAAEWARYTTGSIVPKTTYTPVEPLLTTTWNQLPYYNILCPYDVQDSAYCVSGCVATATAQIMKYWNHPTVGWGSESYNLQQYGILSAQFDTTHYRWDLMPNQLTAVSDSAEVMAVAELMYHIGVAVHMLYSPDGSGAQVINYGISNFPSAETALRTFFRYSPMLHGITKSGHTDSEWSSIMRDEIASMRPVLYSGFDNSSGHAFVFDGYDSLGYFHINWGWGGVADGYFTIDSLSPGIGGAGGNDTYTFNYNNQAVVGIEPMTVSMADSVVVDMRFEPSMGTVDGNGTYAAGDNIVTIVARAAEGNIFDGWASGSSVNPIEFAASGDLTDSAIFTPIRPSDTLGYCSDAMLQTWQDDWGSLTEWGIRLPASMRNPNRSINGVQFFVYRGDRHYTFSVYQGDSICDATLLHSEEKMVYGNYQWVTLHFAEAVPVGNSRPVWITVSHTGNDYPATHTIYSGNSDGSWYHLPSGWATYDHHGLYATWMLRGLFVEREPGDPNSIGSDEAEEIHVRISGRTVTTEADDAYYYDTMGRLVATGRQAEMPTAGVYIVRFGASSTKIVIL